MCGAVRRRSRGARGGDPRGRRRDAAVASGSRTRWRATAASRSGSSRRRSPRPLDGAALRTLLGRDEHQAVAAEMAQVRVLHAQAARAPRPATASPSSPPPARLPATSSTPASWSCARSDSSRSTTRASSSGDATSPAPPDLARPRLHAGLERSRRSRRSSPPAAATAASSCCRCSTPPSFAATPKVFVGYSDNTSLLTWLNSGLRHRGISRTDDRGPARARRCRIRSRLVPALLCRAAADRRDRHPQRRVARTRRSGRACSLAAR